MKTAQQKNFSKLYKLNQQEVQVENKKNDLFCAPLVNRNRKAKNLLQNQSMWKSFQMMVTRFYQKLFKQAIIPSGLIQPNSKSLSETMFYEGQRSLLDMLLLTIENWMLSVCNRLFELNSLTQLDELELIESFRKEFNLKRDSSKVSFRLDQFLQSGDSTPKSQNISEALFNTMNEFNINLRKKFDLNSQTPQESKKQLNLKQEDKQVSKQNTLSKTEIENSTKNLNALEDKCRKLESELRKIAFEKLSSDHEIARLKKKLLKLEKDSKNGIEELKTAKTELSQITDNEAKKNDSQQQSEQKIVEYYYDTKDRLNDLRKGKEVLPLSPNVESKIESFQDPTQQRQFGMNSSAKRQLTPRSIDPNLVIREDFLKCWDSHAYVKREWDTDKKVLTVYRTVQDDKLHPFAVLKKPLKGHLFFKVTIVSIDESFRWFPVGVILESELNTEKGSIMEDKSTWGVGTMWFAGFSYTRNFTGRAATNKPDDPKGHSPGTVFYMEFKSESADGSGPTIKYYNKDGQNFLSNKPLKNENMYLMVIVARMKNKLEISMLETSELPNQIKNELGKSVEEAM